jgi:hypothetical protein
MGPEITGEGTIQVAVEITEEETSEVPVVVEMTDEDDHKGKGDTKQLTITCMSVLLFRRVTYRSDLRKFASLQLDPKFAHSKYL